MSNRGPVLITAAVAGVGAAVCPLVVLPAYVQTSAWVAIWWLVAGGGQAVLAVAALRAPARALLATAAAWSGVVVIVELICRTGGVELREALWGPADTVTGFTDIVWTVSQGVAAVLLGIAVVRWPRRLVHRPVLVATAAAVPLLLVGLLTVAGIALGTDGFTRLRVPAGRELSAHESLAPGTTATLTYCAQRSARLAMEVYEPPATARRPAPVVLYVHGGGMILGDRRRTGLGAGLANHDGALFPQLRSRLAARGLVVASIDYRLAPLVPWPAPLQDATCAVRFLRAHASALGIDPARVGVWGSSAGGQLAALLGTAKGFDVGPDLEQSSRVQAVVDMFGPTDLNAMRHASAFGRTVVQIGLGSSRTVRAAASPLTYVAPEDPPFMILHGTDDALVPPAQSAELARRLAAAHVPVTFIRVRGAGHGLNGHDQQPTPDQLAQTITTFFTRTLGIAR